MEYIKEAQILLYEELCARPVREDEISRATIRFRENIRLANSIASKFSDPYDSALDKEDILQEAYLGLWETCLSFDESKGYAFSTYATPVIRCTILKMLRYNGALKMPRSFADIRSALMKHGFTLPLTDEEIDILIDEHNISRAQILSYSKPSFLSLEDTVAEDLTVSDIISDSTADFQHEFSEDEIEEIVTKVISYIKPKYQDLVEEWIYATLGECRITQAELGKKYNMTQRMVQYVLSQSIDIIRMHRDEIKDMLGI